MTPVPGDSITAQAIQVALALAELSITTLDWHPASIGKPPATKLQARIIDLPSMLTIAPDRSSVLATALSLRVEKRAGSLFWSSTNPTHAAKFAAALQSA